MSIRFVKMASILIAAFAFSLSHGPLNAAFRAEPPVVEGKYEMAGATATRQPPSFSVFAIEQITETAGYNIITFVVASLSSLTGGAWLGPTAVALSQHVLNEGAAKGTATRRYNNWMEKGDTAEQRGEKMQALVYRKMANDLDAKPDEIRKFGVLSNLLDLHVASTAEWHSITDAVYLAFLRRSGRIKDLDWQYIQRFR